MTNFIHVTYHMHKYLFKSTCSTVHHNRQKQKKKKNHAHTFGVGCWVVDARRVSKREGGLVSLIVSPAVIIDLEAVIHI